MSQNKEVLFAQTLKQVTDLAKDQANCVSEEQVQEAFAPLELNGEQLQMVYDYLIKHKIGIGTPIVPEDYLSEEEINYLDAYLEEIEALPKYSDGEREAYTIAAMAGEQDACNRLIEIYLSSVVDIAKLYAGQGALLEDLIGEGNVALSIGVTMLGSLESPKEASGMLAKMMMDAMEAYIEELEDAKKQENKVADKVNLVADKAKELAEELHRKVTVEELAEESGLSVKKIEEAIRMSGRKIEDIDYAEDNL